ncbi:thioredoxin 1 [Streptacidiphilus sp. BW17]|jgi:thioredoxin 1|uniref:thioredoxin family protein n=1 Tax=Streptacidiphilus sp. BW17 TaxID=3156274 RepID=UPI0035156A33
MDVTDASFEVDVLKAEGLVLLLFWAEWSGASKLLARDLDDIAVTYRGRLKVARLNIDDNIVTPAKYAVHAVPALFVFRNGNVEIRSSARSKSQLVDLVEARL